MIATSEIDSEFQTVIPIEIREKFDLDNDYFIEWNINEDNQVILEFIKKLSLDDMVGRYEAKKPINSVKLKQAFKN